jgi:hypothetical protein
VLIISSLVLILANCLSSERAMAIEIRCIEPSKYKYLWLMFENNRQKFSEFLGLKSDEFFVFF